MPGFIDVTLIGDDAQIEHMLNHLSVALSPVGLEGFMQVMVEPYLQERAERRFASEGDDVTGRWAPLKSSTVAIRQGMNYGGSHPINVRTGDLEQYITESSAQVTQTGVGANLTYPGAKATGDLRDKVMTAQAGLDYPSTPPRPVLGMNETDLLAVMTGLAVHIRDWT